MSFTAEIAKLQSTLAQTGARWKAGVTSLSPLSTAQRKQRLGADSSKAAQRLTIAQTASAVAAAHSPRFDWRDAQGGNFVTEVKDQKTCGSCVAFSTVATIESAFQIARANPNSGVNLSEAQMFYCYGAAKGATCESGWWPDDAFNAARDLGVTDETCFPYTPGDQACSLCTDVANRLTKITNWHSISDTAAMKQWIATRGPLTTCFMVYDDFPNYLSGVYHHVSNTQLGGHSVSVVGYSDPDGCWICKNSWDTTWGDGGYFRIAYGDSGIDAAMWAVDGIV